LGHHAEPVVVLEFVFRRALDHIQQRLGNQAFELAEGLLFKDRADVFSSLGITLAQDQLADFVKQGRERVPNSRFNSSLRCRSASFAISPVGSFKNLSIRHRCRCGSMRGAPSSESVIAICRTRSRGPRRREILLLQPQFLQPVPDHKWDIHGIPPRADLGH